MARKPKPIVSITGMSPQTGNATPSRVTRSIDRLMAIQRPAVLAHIRGIRKRNPNASPDEIIHRLERRYLATVTTSGAAVGITAVVPAIGTVTTLALSGVETAAFLEATALFAQSVSEVHGIAVNDPERARALVMALMLGREGSNLVRQWGADAVARNATRQVYWGEVVTSSMPRAVMNPLVDQLKKAFVKRFAASGGASLIGKAIPFGIGAVIGGTGNHILGRRVLANARVAFGAPPPIMRLPETAPNAADAEQALPEQQQQWPPPTPIQHAQQQAPQQFVQSPQQQPRKRGRATGRA